MHFWLEEEASVQKSYVSLCLSSSMVKSVYLSIVAIPFLRPPKAIPLEKVYEKIPSAAGRSAAYQDSVNDGAYSSDKPICTERA